MRWHLNSKEGPGRVLKKSKCTDTEAGGACWVQSPDTKELWIGWSRVGEEYNSKRGVRDHVGISGARWDFEFYSWWRGNQQRLLSRSLPRPLLTTADRRVNWLKAVWAEGGSKKVLQQSQQERMVTCCQSKVVVSYTFVNWWRKKPMSNIHSI